jgi:serine/threonine-protein kinase
MSSPVQVGEILAGKYKVEAVLGIGGMGVVVAARHMQLGERVAIKCLLPQVLDRTDVVTRFLREGQAAARIRSEHIARVYDVGTLENGVPYLVMEYLEGSDLGALLRAQGRFPIEDAVDYVLQACEALADVHALGIIHRDLKPGNLFLTQRNDGMPVIKLIDFGISKVGPQEDPVGPPTSKEEVTQADVTMGTPSFMSPEQMVSARDVDARSDIWSLGIILHCLLTSRVPFQGTNVMEVYDLILKGAPPLRRFRSDAPERLEKIVLRCLRKDRKERYDNVGELAAELAAYGPPHASQSAERTARILRAKAAGRSATPVSAPSFSQPDMKAIPTKIEGAVSVEPRTADTTTVHLPLADSGGTESSWGQLTSLPARLRRRSLVFFALGGGLAGAVAIMLFIRHVSEDSSPSPTSPSEKPIATAEQASAAATPPPAVGADASAAPTPNISAALSASAKAGAIAPTGTRRSSQPRAVEPKKPPPKKKDLFSDPR